MSQKQGPPLSQFSKGLKMGTPPPNFRSFLFGFPSTPSCWDRFGTNTSKISSKIGNSFGPKHQTIFFCRGWGNLWNQLIPLWRVVGERNHSCALSAKCRIPVVHAFVHANKYVQHSAYYSILYTQHKTYVLSKHMMPATEHYVSYAISFRGPSK